MHCVAGNEDTGIQQRVQDLVLPCAAQAKYRKGRKANSSHTMFWEMSTIGVRERSPAEVVGSACSHAREVAE